MALAVCAARAAIAGGKVTDASMAALDLREAELALPLAGMPSSRAVVEAVKTVMFSEAPDESSVLDRLVTIEDRDAARVVMLFYAHLNPSVVIQWLSEAAENEQWDQYAKVLSFGNCDPVRKEVLSLIIGEDKTLVQAMTHMDGCSEEIKEKALNNTAQLLQDVFDNLRETSISFFNRRSFDHACRTGHTIHPPRGYSLRLLTIWKLLALYNELSLDAGEQQYFVLDLLRNLPTKDQEKLLELMEEESLDAFEDFEYFQEHFAQLKVAVILLGFSLVSEIMVRVE